MIPYRVFLSAVVAALIGQVQYVQGAADDGVRKLVLKQIKIANAAVDVSYVRVSLKDSDVRVLAASAPDDVQSTRPLYSDRSASGYSLQDYQVRYGAFAVVSGGYFDSYSPPTPWGLLKSNGTQISEVRRSWLTDGFFCSDVGHVEIMSVSNDAARVGFRDCVQSGPLLLLGKKPVNDPTRDAVADFKKFESAPYERAFACLGDNGDVILGVAGKIELPKLVSALLEPEFDCRDAIALTSSGLAGLRVGDALFGSDDVLFPSVIAIVDRAPELAPRAPDNKR